MAFFGFRAYPTPLVKPMWPFFIAAGVVFYGVNKLQDMAVSTEEASKDPRNPYVDLLPMIDNRSEGTGSAAGNIAFASKTAFSESQHSQRLAYWVAYRLHFDSCAPCVERERFDPSNCLPR
ncbi:hypothetical protein PHSY_005364 [Pseudozyma hubeiensis SY62]|uniref:Uncharacterized protein n=1 Tax=Pseudozyma hubeiensis (strain SY62) TaxID=1305764 RepID=R9P944_PSEHS|nr:hypothetical protein PHSY_005364 [Pseudozyma hubeiensis SY62]GAC97777.1 hypothetical protein PHSY_005364 [Pseudozyma hubeiensis SY62]